ncbi:hypothetical protein U0070_000455 [Myodes glareolus]|uniref:Uncharacterized protein n=1 Tax=Myodes glareolus TaxID=447135 RepID=A0AAW0IQP1_MYOGA
MMDENPKEGVQTENKHPINVKVAEQVVPWCSSQSVKQTPVNCWKWHVRKDTDVFLEHTGGVYRKTSLLLSPNFRQRIDSPTESRNLFHVLTIKVQFPLFLRSPS